MNSFPLNQALVSYNSVKCNVVSTNPRFKLFCCCLTVVVWMTVVGCSTTVKSKSYSDIFFPIKYSMLRLIVFILSTFALLAPCKVLWTSEGEKLLMMKRIKIPCLLFVGAYVSMEELEDTGGFLKSTQTSAAHAAQSPHSWGEERISHLAVTRGTFSDSNVL